MTKKGNDGGKERNLEQIGEDGGWRGWRSKWLNILANVTHAKRIKTQKYANTCLAKYENTARKQCHQAKRLQSH